MEYLNSALEYYNGIKYAEPDPRTKDWFLLENSPLQVHLLSLFYILFVIFGPRVMKDRQAFQLKKVMVVYNFALVLLSVYMFVEIILSSLDCGYGIFCAVYNREAIQTPKEMRVARVLWWYFFSKAVELADTVLMILRKKNNQVTFLHVYHHVTMLNIWWRVMMYIPGGLSTFGSALNCLVHMAMYTYYGLSVFPELREKLWWKKYLTRFQLVQFVITLTHTCASLYVSCDFPSWGQWLMFYYMISMLVLFTNFYVHAYIIRGKKQEVVSDNKKKELHPEGHGNGKALASGSQPVVSNGFKVKRRVNRAL